MRREKAKTRFKDKDGNAIYVGDIVSVEEYPDEYVGGSLSYEGVIEERGGEIYCVYYDIGEEEALPLSMFPKRGRYVLTEEERYRYWKTAMLGGEPDERLYKRELYTKEYENETK